MPYVFTQVDQFLSFCHRLIIPSVAVGQYCFLKHLRVGCIHYTTLPLNNSVYIPSDQQCFLTEQQLHLKGVWIASHTPVSFIVPVMLFRSPAPGFRLLTMLP